eukprot:scaffold29062_cov24-Tisochrysis_lutea.AAC.1
MIRKECRSAADYNLLTLPPCSDHNTTATGAARTGGTAGPREKRKRNGGRSFLCSFVPGISSY